jgi:hypothetical protein
METTQKKLKECLVQFQKYQLMLTGLADVHVEFISIDFELRSVSLSVWPNGRDGKQLLDENGESIWESFKIGTWDDDADANEVMQRAKNYVKTVKASNKK